MKVSQSKFYKEVTGSKTANRKVTEPALERWGVPFDKTDGKGDVVDVAHLDAARAVFAIEQAARDAKRVKPALKDDEDLLMLLIRLEDNVEGISAKLDRLLAMNGSKP